MDEIACSCIARSFGICPIIRSMKHNKQEPVPRSLPENIPPIGDLAPVDAEALFAGERIQESLIQNLVLSGRTIDSLVA